MRFFSSIESYQSDQPVILSIGNFDGIHRGHQYLLQNNLELASLKQGRSVVLTFYPHPMQVLKRNVFAAPLYSSHEQGQVLEKLGIDDWIQEPFTKNVQEESPIHFWERLYRSMNLQAIVVGPDFRFGNNRSGDAQILSHLCQKHHVLLELPEPYVYRGERVSSTLIRQLLLRGDLESAADFLGRAYSLTGKVAAGQRRGRKLGYPTANMKTPQAQNLKRGVYNSLVTVNGQVYRAATNIGFHPTIEEVNEVQVECHILDFETNIYNEEIRVEFLHYIRSEKKFSNIEELKDQIEKDVQFVRKS